jgi:hypothetical protein
VFGRGAERAGPKSRLAGDKQYLILISWISCVKTILLT